MTTKDTTRAGATPTQEIGTPGIGVPGPLAVRTEPLPPAPSVEWLKGTLTDSQIRTLTSTVAWGATEDELAVFFWAARRRGLDPFLRQIHFVKRRRREGKHPDGSPRYVEYAVHQTGIDGLRVIAARIKADGKNLLAGIRRGPIKDKDGLLIGGWAEVYRHDWTMPARTELDFKEYVQTVEYNGQQTTVGLWQTKPQTMIEKCAEAAALRMAFHEDLGDLYIHEEMDSAEHVRPLNREEKEPVSSATVLPPDGIVEAEILTTTQSDSAEHVGILFEETDDPRRDLAASILHVLDTFTQKPNPGQWERITGFFTGVARAMTVEALSSVDAGALSDLVGFLKAMQAGDVKAVGKWKAEVSKWTAK